MSDDGFDPQAYRTFRDEMELAAQLPTREQRLAATTAAYQRYCDIAEAPLRALRRVIVPL